MVKEKVTKFIVLFALLGLTVSIIGCSTATEDVNSITDPVKIVEEHVNAINNKDYDKVMDYLASGFVYRDDFDEIKGKNEIEALIKEIIELDSEIEILNIEEVDNKVVIEANYTSFITEYLGLKQTITETFEFENGKISALTALSDEEYLAEYEKATAGGVGINFDFKDGEIIVLETPHDGPAANAGIEKGDHIVAIDQYKVSDFNYGAMKLFTE